MKKNYLRFDPAGKIWNFMSFRKAMMYIFAASVLISVLAISIIGVNFSIDFTGGILIEAELDDGVEINQIRTIVGKFSNSSVQTFGEEGVVLIRISDTLAKDEASLNKTLTDLRASLDDKIKEIRRAELVGPTIGSEIKKNSLYTVLLALFVILAYIWFRFEWQYGLAGIIALLHDVLIVIGLYSIFNINFSVQTVAAILAVAGYSINDSVVQFDRLRENSRKFSKLSLAELINKSVSETLSRTFMTSITTLLAVTALVFFGGLVLRDLTWALFFGVIVGTWSSIAIAMTLVLFFRPKKLEADS